MLRFLLFLLAPALLAQPRIGLIDLYGVRRVPAAEIRKALAVQEGDALPPSKGDAEERIEKVAGVVRAHLEAACCDEGRAILYVGVEEKDSPHFDYRQPPAGEAILPDELHRQYARFLSAVTAAGRSGKTAEDLTEGHSLMADPDVREIQQGFVLAAADHFDQIRKVLRESANAEHRAIAAYLIGYSKKKSEVTADLLFALQDSDDTVRNNAIRSLAAFAVLARRNPESGIRIAPTWFVEMLNSVVWSDRNNAAIALVTLTDSRDPKMLEQLKERALPALADMAGWKHLPHALPGYILLGRALGLAEESLQESWSAGKRDVVIARARKLVRR